jgi:hypothetical protein
MNDQGSSSESGVMKAAASAAFKVSNWSASKQEFASRVTNNGSFAGAGSSAGTTFDSNTTPAAGVAQRGG